MTSIWIKICGMTDELAVATALEAGVDAVGFVFAPSVRRVDPQQARKLATAARGRAVCVAVTQHPEAALIAQILAEFGPDVLQTDAEDFEHLDLPQSLQRMPVVRVGTDAAVLEQRLATSMRALIEGRRSGTGLAGDWQGMRKLADSLRTHDQPRQIVLAGGLDAGNVAEAIRIVRPFGVDVSSGVEERPGVKSAQRIGEFVQAARGAT